MLRSPMAYVSWEAADAGVAAGVAGLLRHECNGRSLVQFNESLHIVASDELVCVKVDWADHIEDDDILDIDDAVAGVEEQHRVQVGHVHTFGQTPGIGQNPARIGVALFQPRQAFVTFGGVHGAVDVADIDL